MSRRRRLSFEVQPVRYNLGYSKREPLTHHLDFGDGEVSFREEGARMGR